VRNPSPSRRSRILATLFAGLALLIAMLAAEAFRRHGLYWYDVRRDQAYDFTSASHRALPVEIGTREAILPAWDKPWDTALLRLHVSARLTGWWFEPCLMIGSGAHADRQCFERGADGDRYLLLRPSTAVSGQRLELRGQHLDWQPQSAELLLFDNQDLGQGRVLVLPAPAFPAHWPASGRPNFPVRARRGWRAPVSVRRHTGLHHKYLFLLMFLLLR
jgi:hypothetical protein